MQTMNISLPTKLANKLDAAVDSGGYASRSEFVRTLLREYEANNTNHPIIFKKKPLKIVEKNLRDTGLYNEKFIKSVVSGLANSSIYAKD